MSIINEPQRSKLYTRIKHLLGYPLRSIEIKDEMMDSLLELSIQDYSQYVNDWLIESQWTSLYGLNLDEQSLTRAFLTRSLDWETQYTYAYSKIVGLQAGGDSVLKKDYIDLKSGQQIYEIPAGRELNELLWFTRSELDAAYFDPFMGGFGGFGGIGLGGAAGYSQLGNQGNYFITPAFDILLRMQDISVKRRIIAGELTYRVTALPGGKKAIHLINTPGGKFDFGTIQNNEYKVWYWYYDTNDRETCLAENPDVVRLPSDIPVDDLWEELNNPSQTWIRKWFVSYCKETLGRVRGKFGGNLKTPDSELQLEYDSLLTEAKDERTKLLEELQVRLERLRPDKMMEVKKQVAESLNKSLQYRALPSNSIVYNLFMAIFKSYPVQKIINGLTINTSDSSIVTHSGYKTNGESVIVVKCDEECILYLDDKTTDHCTVKAMCDMVLSSEILIDEEFNEIELQKGASVELKMVGDFYYILSSDGLKNS